MRRWPPSTSLAPACGQDAAAGGSACAGGGSAAVALRAGAAAAHREERGPDDQPLSKHMRMRVPPPSSGRSMLSSVATRPITASPSPSPGLWGFGLMPQP